LEEKIKIVKLSALSGEQKQQLAVLERAFFKERLNKNIALERAFWNQARFDYFVALSNGKPVGFVAGGFSKEKDRFTLGKIFVALEARRKGLSKRLVVRCIAVARQHRAPVEIVMPNDLAWQSYLSVGKTYYEKYASRKRGGKPKLSFNPVAVPKISFVQGKKRK